MSTAELVSLHMPLQDPGAEIHTESVEHFPSVNVGDC